MKLLARLLALFLIMPVVELALLIQVDSWIGFWPTIGVILGTGLLGSYMARREGLSVWRRFNERLNAGGLPGTELLDGVIILIAGALLITPGVITDVLGFMGLFPPSRRLIRRVAMKRVQRAMQRGNISVVGMDGWTSGGPSGFGPEKDNAPSWQGMGREVPRHSESSDDGPPPSPTT